MQCSGAGDVNAIAPEPVNEQAALGASALNWLEGDIFFEPNGGSSAWFEHGVITADAAEQMYTWDFAASEWVDNTANIESLFVLSASGVAEYDDRYRITGFGAAGEVAAIEPTVDGVAAGDLTQDVELSSLDISGVPVWALMDPAFAAGIPESQTFSAGAQAYVASIRARAGYYEFGCDHSWGPWFEANLSCDNIVAVTWQESPNGFVPTPATSLDEVVNQAGTTMPMVAGMEIGGADGQFALRAYLKSDDGTAAGANLHVVFMREFFNGSAPSPAGQAPVQLASVGETLLLSFTVPAPLRPMLHDDENTTFGLFVESTLDSAPYVRMAAYVGTDVQYELLFNDIAAADVVNNFNPQLEGGEPDSDHDGVPDSQDPAPQDPTIPNGQGPMDSDNDGVPDSEDPAPLDPTIPNGQPPQGNPEVGQGLYMTQCASCHGGDAMTGIPLLPLKQVYPGERDLVAYIADTMPLLDPTTCGDVCAMDIAAYLRSLMQGGSGAGFPQKLSVSSPLAPLTASSAAMQKIRPSMVIADLLASILADRSALTSLLDVDEFFTSATSAHDCYGPALNYSEHPDGSPGNNGQLPPGDLGIWRETMPDTDADGVSEACAAAQLNAQLAAVENRTTMALAVLAAMKSAYDDTGNSDISSLLPSGVTATGATLTETIAPESDLTAYGITLTADYNSDGTFETVTIRLNHAAHTSDADIYEGILTLQVTDTFTGGNCGMGSNAVTRYTSVHYISNAASDLRLQSREATYCGNSPSAISGHMAFGETALTQSPDLTGFVLAPTTNWADNFAVFTAAYDPTTSGGDLTGHYSYTWQAGAGDSHSRILDVGLSVGVAGESWFGYGSRVQDVSVVNEFGVIQGFICNWAGPGADHTLQDYAQRQHLSLDESGIYTVADNGSSSNITYAPTNSCTYDGSGSFTYDRDLDGDLTDENSTTLTVTAGSNLDLLAVNHPADFTSYVDPSDTIPDIWEVITNARNYRLPAYPSN